MTAKNSAAKPVVAWARDLGCEVRQHKSHWRVTYRGRSVGSIPSTPSDPRSMLNVKTFIRRNVRKLGGVA